MYFDFIANDTTSVFSKITEKDVIRYKKYDDQILLGIPEVRECIRINLELMWSYFLQGFLVRFSEVIFNKVFHSSFSTEIIVRIDLSTKRVPLRIFYHIFTIKVRIYLLHLKIFTTTCSERTKYFQLKHNHILCK